ncbi:MAG: prephenate dehydrogenase [Christensenellales bacterium]
MNIVIVGLGVIGGSFALALQKAGYTDVYGVDTNEQTLEKAEKMGVIQKGCTTGKEFFPKADLIILAIYPNLIRSFVEQNQVLFKPGCVVTDTTGIKSPFINEITQALPDGVDFVFGHPMAGREKKGIDFASVEVFQGANYLITPTPRNKEENLQKIETLVRRLGFGRVRRITPAFHDEMIAFTSQLPHAMAVALINSDEEGRDTGSFIGDSYRDLTRIANINETLWSELFLGNKKNLLRTIENFEKQLDLIKTAIENDDTQALTVYFKTSTKRRELLNR